MEEKDLLDELRKFVKDSYASVILVGSRWSVSVCV